MEDTEEVLIGSTEFIVFREKDISAEHIYCISRDASFRNLAEKSMSGASGRQRVQNECFSKYLLPVPPFQINTAFKKIVAPFFEEIYVLHRQNNILKNSRDLLLPRLIRGELDVESLDIPV